MTLLFGGFDTDSLDTEEAPQLHQASVQEDVDLSFAPALAPQAEEVKAICSHVVKSVQRYEAEHALRTRRRRATDQALFERIINALTCNLLKQHLLQPIVALPVHDALIVPLSAEQAAKEIMRATFYEWAGVECLVSSLC
ncbi:hypothetical protein LJC46_08400 [Desulfovibrio sp. OttesenSCG-928-G15]|nr:hypothetical protein [Desulfovibrio sp. OttesenSCG-928-G15]